MLMDSVLNALIPDKQARINNFGQENLDLLESETFGAELFTRSESWSDRCQGFSQCIANATSIETTNPRFRVEKKRGMENHFGI